MRQPALILLAGGASRRLGQCKALVDIGGSHPLERLHHAGRCLDEHAHLVVSGADDEAIRAAAPADLEVVTNRAWEAGRASSVRRAIEARPGLDLVLAPVDVPLVEAGVFERLLASWLEGGSPARGWLAPHWSGDAAEKRFGHPVVVGRDLAEEFSTWSGDRPLRAARERARPVWSVPALSRAVLDDLDTPGDLSGLRSRVRSARP